jgi:hypothetical protein
VWCHWGSKIACPSSKLNPHEIIGGCERLGIGFHGDRDKRGRPIAGSELRTRNSLLLEAIALRHQIAVLERSRTRRPCSRRFDRLLWILLSRF